MRADHVALFGGAEHSLGRDPRADDPKPLSDMDLRPNDAALAAGADVAWPAVVPPRKDEEPVPKAEQPSTSDAGYTGLPRAVITASYFACFGSIGVSLASLGPSLLELSATLHSDVDTLGFLFVARACGYLTGSAAAGWLFDRVRNTHALIIAGQLLSACGCAVLPRLGSVASSAVAVSTQGICMGLLDTGGNVLLIWLHGQRRVEPYMQAMHSCFGLGAFLAPLLVDASIGATGSIRTAFDGLAVVLALAALPLIGFVGPSKPAEETAAVATAGCEGAGDGSGGGGGADGGGGSEAAAVDREAARRRHACFVALCSLTLCLYVGAEVAFCPFHPFTAPRKITVPASSPKQLANSVLPHRPFIAGRRPHAKWPSQHHP